jgi:hypothetical protein
LQAGFAVTDKNDEDRPPTKPGGQSSLKVQISPKTRTPEIEKTERMTFKSSTRSKQASENSPLFPF